jgi:hypothetical protein
MTPGRTGPNFLVRLGLFNENMMVTLSVLIGVLLIGIVWGAGKKQGLVQAKIFLAQAGSQLTGYNPATQTVIPPILSAVETGPVAEPEAASIAVHSTTIPSTTPNDEIMVAQVEVPGIVQPDVNPDQAQFDPVTTAVDGSNHQPAVPVQGALVESELMAGNIGNAGSIESQYQPVVQPRVLIPELAASVPGQVAAVAQPSTTLLVPPVNPADLDEVLYEGEEITQPQQAEVRPAAREVVKATVSAEHQKLVVEGIFWDSEKPMAIINGEIYGAGEKVANARVKTINKSSIIFEFQGNEFRVRP